MHRSDELKGRGEEEGKDLITMPVAIIIITDTCCLTH